MVFSGVNTKPCFQTLRTHPSDRPDAMLCFPRRRRLALFAASQSWVTFWLIKLFLEWISTYRTIAFTWTDFSQVISLFFLFFPTRASSSTLLFFLSAPLSLAWIHNIHPHRRRGFKSSVLPGPARPSRLVHGGAIVNINNRSNKYGR